MEIRLLNKGYKNNQEFYKDFMEGKILDKEEYFSGEVVEIDEIPNFPIYMNIKDEKIRKSDFFEAFNIISKYYLKTDRDIHFDELFWHSLFCVYKREYLLEKYPQIANGVSFFNNIVTKKFDWENYIYKCILGAQYISDNVNNENEYEKYFNLIIENLDLYNYIIKYEIFRNDKFLLNVLDITNDLRVSTVLKAKIKGRDDLGKDERVGRRVIFEFNKSYPVVMSPMLEKDELQKIFIEYLGLYTNIDEIILKIKN